MSHLEMPLTTAHHQSHQCQRPPPTSHSNRRPFGTAARTSRRRLSSSPRSPRTVVRMAPSLPNVRGTRSSDEPYIAYYDYTNGDLKVAHHDGSAWSIFTVDSSGDVGQQSDIAVDSNDVVYISYYDSTNAIVKMIEGY